LAAQKRSHWQGMLIIVFLLGLIVAWLGFGEQGLIHLYRKDMERQAYLERIQRLTDENHSLQKEIRRLRTDMEYMEYVIRKELNLIKDNEIIYRFKKKSPEKTD